MKKLFCFCLFVMLMCITAFSAVAEDSEKTYTVKNIQGEYVLLSDDAEIKRDNSIIPVLEEVSGYVFFDNVRIFEVLELTDIKAVFSGSIFSDGSALVKIGEGADITFSELSVDMMSQGSYIKVSGGSLTLDNSKITAEDSCALYLDTVGDLKILNDSKITAKDFDIISESRVAFCDGKDKYTGENKFKICYLGEEKSLSGIADFADEPPINLYSRGGDEMPIYRISYFNEYANAFSEYRLHGEELALPDAEEISGYEFCGWILESTSAFPPATAEASVTLYADYKLKPPVFSVNGTEFKYDGKLHIISPKGITHPILSEGALSYRWYKDEKLVSEERNLALKNVSDSGKYTLEVEFQCGKERSVGRVGDISVTVLPVMLLLEYRGDKFEISEGNVIEGEAPEIFTLEKDGEIVAETSDNNYCLDFSPQKLKTKSTELQVLGWALVLLSVIIFIGYFVFFSLETDVKTGTLSRVNTGLYSDDPFVISRYNSEKICEGLFSVDKPKADALLTDRMAKGMIRRGGAIETSGKGIETVSLGDICTHFKSCDIVNINLLKKRGLISENSSKVKVISDGYLDKPLKIMANDFDISAVKMITLSGGEAIKIKSRKTRKNT